MLKTKLLVISMILVVFSLISCKASSDDGNGSQNNPPSIDYTPQTNGGFVGTSSQTQGQVVKEKWMSSSGNLKVKGTEIPKTSEVVVIPTGTIAQINFVDDNGVQTIFKKGRNVKLSPFVMSQYPVTRGLFKAVMDNEYYSNLGTQASATGTEDENPVTMVNWFDAIVFCNKLSIACGLKPVYSYNFGNGEMTNPDDWFTDENNLSDSVPISEFNSNLANWRDEIKINLKANGYRLPTDAEWEFAARGGDPNEKDENEKLIWFYTYSGSDSSSEVAWCPRTGESKTGTNVVGGMPKANRLGIYDMSGNVSEWCNDYYYEISEEVNKDDSNYLDQDGYVNNPMIVSSNNARRLRGGNWSSTEGSSGVYFRGECWAAFGRDKSYGFRLVRSTQ